MKKLRIFSKVVLALVLALSIFSCASVKTVEPVINTDGYKVSSYIRTWPLGSTPEQAALNEHWSADTVKAEYLTDLIVAFAHIDQETWGLYFPDAESEVSPFPTLWEEVAALQAKYPHLDMHVSVGGYGADGFSEMSADDTKRATFVGAVVDLVKEKNLDGIDIDWEYPIGPDWGQAISCSPNDGENFIKLLSDLRVALDALEQITDKDYTVSIAVPASTWYVSKIDVVKVASLVDTMKVMSYDYYGSWSAQTGHHANLYNNPKDPDWGGWSTDQTIRTYLDAGVPAEKLILGVAFYGRAWEGVQENGVNGLFQKYTASVYNDGLAWPDLQPFLAEGSGFTRYWDDVAKAPYLYNGDIFITYTDPEAIQYIGEYVKEKGLGGVMTWEYGHDAQAELLEVLANSVQ